MVLPTRSLMVAAALVASVGLSGPNSPALADYPEYSPSDAPIVSDGDGSNGIGSDAANSVKGNADADLSGVGQAQPRFRMADSTARNIFGTTEPRRTGEPRHNGNGRIDGQASKEDFLWANLTANSPASGLDPEIGNKANHSYYDFRDGFDLPKYVAGPKAAK